MLFEKKIYPLTDVWTSVRGYFCAYEGEMGMVK